MPTTLPSGPGCGSPPPSPVPPYGRPRRAGRPVTAPPTARMGPWHWPSPTWPRYGTSTGTTWRAPAADADAEAYAGPVPGSAAPPVADGGPVAASAAPPVADGGPVAASGPRLAADGGPVAASGPRLAADGGPVAASGPRLAADGGPVAAAAAPPAALDMRAPNSRTQSTSSSGPCTVKSWPRRSRRTAIHSLASPTVARRRQLCSSCGSGVPSQGGSWGATTSAGAAKVTSSAEDGWRRCIDLRRYSAASPVGSSRGAKRAPVANGSLTRSTRNVRQSARSRS